MEANDNCRGYEKHLKASGVRLSKRHVAIPKGCWMCGKYGVKMSKEHVIPVWLQERFKIKDVLTNQAHISSSGDILATREVGFANLVQGRICETNCNNGWMSKLETDFQELFINDWREGIKKNPTVFARWIAKTMTVINISQPRRIIIDEQGRHGLVDERELPEGWSVYVYETSSNMPEIITWEQGGPVFALLKSDSEMKYETIVERVFVGCIKVDDMVGVAYYKPKEIKNLAPLVPLQRLYPKATNESVTLPYGGVWLNQCLVNIELREDEWQDELDRKREDVKKAFIK